MDYNDIDIRVEKRRYVEKLSQEGQCGKAKEVVVTENSVIVRLCNLVVPDPAFIFELQAIIEEFSAKKLSSYNETTVLNSIFDTSDSSVYFSITRQESSLLITLWSYAGEFYDRIILSKIQAKSLACMVNKAVRTMDLK